MSCVIIWFDARWSASHRQWVERKIVSRHRTALNNIAQCCAALSRHILYCIVQYCTVLYCTVLFCTLLYCTIPYCTVLYCTIPYWNVLFCTVLYYTVLERTVLCCTVLLTLLRSLLKSVLHDLFEAYLTNIDRFPLFWRLGFEHGNRILTLPQLRFQQNTV